MSMSPSPLSWLWRLAQEMCCTLTLVIAVVTAPSSSNLTLLKVLHFVWKLNVHVLSTLPIFSNKKILQILFGSQFIFLNINSIKSDPYFHYFEHCLYVQCRIFFCLKFHKAFRLENLLTIKGKFKTDNSKYSLIQA